MKQVELLIVDERKLQVSEAFWYLRVFSGWKQRLFLSQNIFKYTFPDVKLHWSWVNGFWTTGRASGANIFARMLELRFRKLQKAALVKDVVVKWTSVRFFPLQRYRSVIWHIAMEPGWFVFINDQARRGDNRWWHCKITRLLNCSLMKSICNPKIFWTFLVMKKNVSFFLLCKSTER